MNERLLALDGLANWESSSAAVDGEHEVIWKTVATSASLRNLAIEGRRLYESIFDEDLRQQIGALPPGSRLTIHWRRDNRKIENIPWTLLYQGGEPGDNDPVDPLQFLGLRFRLELVESRPTSSLCLGRMETSHRGHVFYWQKEGGAVSSEALIQHNMLQSLPGYISVPEKLPPSEEDAQLKKLAKALLRAESPSPMTLLYLFCECAMSDAGKPELYFGRKTSDVTILESDLPGTTAPNPNKPFVFINACSTSTTAGTMKANLLESNFLNRKCRAYLGTINRIPVHVASRFAQAFFHFFLPRAGVKPLSAGEAVAQARLFFWTRYKNISGLYYHYINDYDIVMQDKIDIDGGG